MPPKPGRSYAQERWTTAIATRSTYPETTEQLEQAEHHPSVLLAVCGVMSLRPGDNAAKHHERHGACSPATLRRSRSA